MIFPSRETLKKVKERFPVGCRVELDSMNDLRAPARGTKGTVQFVDDTGTVFVRWDNGSSLGVVYGEDSCHRVND